jgi:ATP/maltotriose-dependent transcriptional regulator MalT/DNA-binding SARP family transcriptional activator
MNRSPKVRAMGLSESREKKRRTVTAEHKGRTNIEALPSNRVVHSSIAKISPPKVLEATQRPRLFKLLDQCGKSPVTWASAPGGSGKTTLVASYLYARSVPCIWYNCDEGDADLATFFYYMGLSAKKALPRRKISLPLLTQEYLAGISTFARRYFEKLCGHLSSRRLSSADRAGTAGVIVLDNYQDVPAKSLFHSMIVAGMEGISEGVRVLVISRGKPPASFSRLEANGRITRLDYEEIRFTLDESTHLARKRIPRLGTEAMRRMHEMAQGWAAGITLMLERGKIPGPEASAEADFSYEGVFNYFAGEIFDGMDQGTRVFLLQTALLSQLDVSLVNKLTGGDTAQKILSSLHSHHLFTEKLSGSGQNYRYHPLLKEFLLNKASSVYSSTEVAMLRRKAAQILDEAGLIEDAAKLYADAKDQHGLARLIKLHARELLDQGRNKTVEGWLAGISAELADDPWLLYWRGMSSIPADMADARTFLEKALTLFRAGEDVLGIYLSWAGIVDTYFFGLDEWPLLDNYIKLFEELRRSHASFPNQETELIVSSRMFIALTLRNTDQPQRIQSWLERVHELFQTNPSFEIQMDTLFCASIYFLWTGAYDKNAVLLERMDTETRSRKSSPFSLIRVKLMLGIHHWITAEYDAALRNLTEGLQISEESGVHVFDSLLWSFRSAAELAPGNFERAEESLEQQKVAMLGSDTALNAYFYHVNAAWYALLVENPSLALEHLELISAKAARMGTPYYRALWHIGMAQTKFLLDLRKEATKHLETARSIGQSMKSQVIDWYSLLVEAWFQLEQGKTAEGLLALHRGLSLGRRFGYVHLEFYQPVVMRSLFSRALDEKIEPEYVKGLIRKLTLTPPDAGNLHPWTASYTEEWPFPVKIHTLGRFDILLHEEPLQFSGKEQKKPLEMLKTLIALGCVEVSAERLTDALWPNADGDLAHKSFETTLSRLRGLFATGSCLLYRSGRVSLNPLCCWVDSSALERHLAALRSASPEEAAVLREKILSLYQGEFLETDVALAQTAIPREKYRRGVLSIILAEGTSCERNKEWASAADHYTRGIAIDNLAEEFYLRLMVCQRELGNYSSAARTYLECRNLLRDELGIAPSPKTTAIYNSLKESS